MLKSSYPRFLFLFVFLAMAAVDLSTFVTAEDVTADDLPEGCIDYGGGPGNILCPSSGNDDDEDDSDDDTALPCEAEHNAYLLCAADGDPSQCTALIQAYTSCLINLHPDNIFDADDGPCKIEESAYFSCMQIDPASSQCHPLGVAYLLCDETENPENYDDDDDSVVGACDNAVMDWTFCKTAAKAPTCNTNAVQCLVDAIGNAEPPDYCSFANTQFCAELSCCEECASEIEAFHKCAHIEAEDDFVANLDCNFSCRGGPISPIKSPSSSPSGSPSESPRGSPRPSTAGPGSLSEAPSGSPSPNGSSVTLSAPSGSPGGSPFASPSGPPSVPGGSPSGFPSSNPSTSGSPTSSSPSGSPTVSPSGSPTGSPTASPSSSPSGSPTDSPSASPSGAPPMQMTISKRVVLVVMLCWLF